MVPLLPLLVSAINGFFWTENFSNKIVNTVALNGDGIVVLRPALEAVREFPRFLLRGEPHRFPKGVLRLDRVAGDFRAGFDLRMTQLTVVRVLVSPVVGFLFTSIRPVTMAQ